MEMRAPMGRPSFGLELKGGLLDLLETIYLLDGPLYHHPAF